MNLTGRAAGTLEPIIYFCRSDGYKILPTYDAGKPELARKVYEERYKNHATERWAWCETDGTLSAVDALQKDLEEQERRTDKNMLMAHTFVRDAVRDKVAENLRLRMVSAGTSEYERDFIAAYLRLREDPKRDKYRQALEHRNYYLYARERHRQLALKTSPCSTRESSGERRSSSVDNQFTLEKFDAFVASLAAPRPDRPDMIWITRSWSDDQIRAIVAGGVDVFCDSEMYARIQRIKAER